MLHWIRSLDRVLKGDATRPDELRRGSIDVPLGGLSAVVRLLIAALGVMLALQASFGTIVVFFSVSTTSYPFMVLLNVVLFAVSGFLGLAFLLQTLHRLSLAQRPAPDDAL